MKKNLFEYDIAYKIYNYDLKNIEKEIEWLTRIINMKGSESLLTRRLSECLELKIKKEKQISDLNLKYNK
jgi:hypothetical protein